MISLIDEQGYTILEDFLYDYKTQTGLRYRKGDGVRDTESFFSEVLGIDLGPFA